MFNKTRDYSIFSSKIVLIVFLIVSITFPVFLGNFKTKSTINYKHFENDLNTNEFTKDNYSAILPFEEYGLGSVSIDDMHFNKFVLGIINNTQLNPLLDEDVIISGALKIDIESVEFIETINPAIKDNLNVTNRALITVKLNETLRVEYNNTNEGYLIYFTQFADAKLLEFYVDNGTSIVNLTEGIDYTLNHLRYLVFYYEDYFQQRPSFNFSMHLIWEYGINLENWALEQIEETPLIMSGREQNFTSRFTYRFLLVGWAILPDLSDTTPIYYIDVALRVSPPDKELLTYQDLVLTGINVNINDYANPDKTISIEVADHFGLNGSFISLNFTCDFGLKFEEPIGNSWAVDRLVAGRNTRERIYFISMITGPPHIFLKNVALYDPGIFSDQDNLNKVLGASSLYNREVLFSDANASTPGQLGLKVIMPYLIVGETCPFSIKYLTSQILKFVVTDTIKMPLVGADVEILHFGAIYGTYISNKSVQPINAGKTDENGQVVLYDVPRGNYTVKVIWEGEVVIVATITTDKEVNYVFTSVPHFPLWILIFGMISGIVLVVGSLFYLKYKKLR